MQAVTRPGSDIARTMPAETSGPRLRRQTPTVPGHGDNRPSARASWLGPGKRVRQHDFYSDSME